MAVRTLKVTPANNAISTAAVEVLAMRQTPDLNRFGSDRRGIS